MVSGERQPFQLVRINSAGKRWCGNSILAKLVVPPALFRITQDTVSAGDLAKALYGFNVCRLASSLILGRKFQKRTLDLLLRGGAAHAQYFVVIAFCLRRQNYLNR
jgi:hypothetical protein